MRGVTRRRRRLVPLLATSLLVAVGPPACNQVAGIADFRTGEPDAIPPESGADGPSESAAADAPSDAPPAFSSCSPSQVGLIIEVGDPAGHFTGISDGSGLFSTFANGILLVGETFNRCVPTGTQLDLRAEPGDPSSATHNWGLCGAAMRRCNLVVNTPTLLVIDLE